MAKKNLDSIAIGIVAVFVGLVALAFTQSIFDLFFVAVVVGVLWSDSNKLNDLQRRLSTLEQKLSSATSS